MEIQYIEIDKIIEDPDQPRRDLDEFTLQGLAESIKLHGLLQPITVCLLDSVNMYKIITGERRWRACQIAEITEIPCVVKPSQSKNILTEQLIENLQREDLQPLDKAKALVTIKQQDGMSNKELGDLLGLGERAVSNLLSIINLPEEISSKIVSTPNRPAEGKLTEKHARHLRQLSDDPELQSKVVDKIERERLSGDDTGRLIGEMRRNPSKSQTLLEEPVFAAVSMPANTATGPAIKVIDIARYLQGLELTKISGKQLESLQLSLTELRKTSEILLEEIEKLNANRQPAGV